MRAVSRSLFVFAILVAFVFTAGFCETATAESDAEAQAAYELVALNTNVLCQTDFAKKVEGLTPVSARL